MKKLGYLTCAALLAFASCTNEINEEGFVDKTKAISFNAYPNKTRVVTGDVTSDNMKDGTFGVFGYFGNSPYLYKLEGETKKAVEQYWNKIDDVNGSWEYKTQSELKFWPDGQMDFYAYFPYGDNVTFLENNSSGNVMTISNLDFTNDVLFAQTTTEYTDRVPLTFHHAFSKIQGLNIKVNGGNVGEANVVVTVKDIEFINTSRSGNVQVDKDGKASYTVASSNVSLKKNFGTAQTISKDITDGVNLISGTENFYFFATNADETNNVKGTGKDMWSGKKASLQGSKLSSSDFVCLKLTCKVKDKTHYLVGTEGTEDNSYGVVYIPLTGSYSDERSITTFHAGKRYTFNIVFSHNVGFTDNGDPILKPILFNVTSVDSWEDVTITITL